MSRLLFLAAIVALSFNRGGLQGEKPSPITITAEPTVVDTIKMQIDTVPSEDRMLHNVNLTFDFIAERIGREMYWDDQENLVVKSENPEEPDTVYLSRSWTYPRMILSYKTQQEPTVDKIVGYESGNHYIDSHAKTAIRLQLEGGVPASITLAQGIHESAWGGSKLAKVHNHFGIKCQGRKHGKKNKYGKRLGEILGHCTNLHDDDENDMFFRYQSAEQSYVAHDKLLHRIVTDDDGNERRTKGSYGFILREIRGDQVTRKFIKIKGAMGLVDGKTYTFSYWEWWAIELKNFGYATDPKYAEKIIRTIKNYNLIRYDQISYETNIVSNDVSFSRRNSSSQESY